MIAAWLLHHLVAFLVATTNTCPRAWWLDGVRPDGRFHCLLSRGDDDTAPIARVDGHITCSVGELAVVVDAHTVGCHRGQS